MIDFYKLIKNNDNNKTVFLSINMIACNNNN